MRFFLIFLLSAFTVEAGTVHVYLTNYDQTLATNSVVITEINQPIFNGSYQAIGLPKLVASTNGHASKKLVAGIYESKVYGLPLVAPVLFAMPDDDADYDLIDVRISGGNVFNYSPGVQRITNTPTVTVVGNGKGTLGLTAIAGNGQTNIALAGVTNAGSAGYSNANAFSLSSATNWPVSGITNAGSAAYSNASAFVLFNGRASNANFVLDTATNKIPLASVTNAGTAGYSNANAFQLAGSAHTNNMTIVATFSNNVVIDTAHQIYGNGAGLSNITASGSGTGIQTNSGSGSNNFFTSPVFLNATNIHGFNSGQANILDGCTDSAIFGESSAMQAALACFITGQACFITNSADSFAGGFHAAIREGTNCVFVWADGSSAQNYFPQSNNTFNVRASGGAFFSSNITSGGFFIGDGSKLTGLGATNISGGVAASNITSGTIAAARTGGLTNHSDVLVTLPLVPNQVLIWNGLNWTNSAQSGVSLGMVTNNGTGTNNVFTAATVNGGTFAGTGTGLTNLNAPASAITNAGTIIYSNAQSFVRSGGGLATNVTLYGVTSGSGEGLTNLPSTNLIGFIKAARLGTNTGSSGQIASFTGDSVKWIAETIQTNIAILGITNANHLTNWSLLSTSVVQATSLALSNVLGPGIVNATNALVRTNDNRNIILTGNAIVVSNAFVVGGGDSGLTEISDGDIYSERFVATHFGANGPGFAGDASGLSNAPATTLFGSGLIPQVYIPNLPLSRITNAGTLAYSNVSLVVKSTNGFATNLTLYGTTSANGAGITNLNLTNTFGTLAAARLPALAVGYPAAHTNNMTIAATFSNNVVVDASHRLFGDGGGLTNLTGSGLITAGTNLSVSGNTASLIAQPRFDGTYVTNVSVLARSVNTSAPLLGGGLLDHDLTLSVDLSVFPTNGSTFYGNGLGLTNVLYNGIAQSSNVYDATVGYLTGDFTSISDQDGTSGIDAQIVTNAPYYVFQTTPYRILTNMNRVYWFWGTNNVTASQDCWTIGTNLDASLHVWLASTDLGTNGSTPATATLFDGNGNSKSGVIQFKTNTLYNPFIIPPFADANAVSNRFIRIREVNGTTNVTIRRWNTNAVFNTAGKHINVTNGMSHINSPDNAFAGMHRGGQIEFANNNLQLVITRIINDNKAVAVQVDLGRSYIPALGEANRTDWLFRPAVDVWTDNTIGAENYGGFMDSNGMLWFDQQQDQGFLSFLDYDNGTVMTLGCGPASGVGLSTVNGMEFFGMSTTPTNNSYAGGAGLSWQFGVHLAAPSESVIVTDKGALALSYGIINRHGTFISFSNSIQSTFPIIAPHPTNTASFNFTPANPGNWVALTTRTTNVAQRATLEIDFGFVDVATGTPVAQVNIEQGNQITNNWICSMPGTVISTITNHYSFKLTTNAVVTITDVSRGSGASVTIANSQLTKE